MFPPSALEPWHEAQLAKKSFLPASTVSWLVAETEVVSMASLATA